MMAGSVQLGFKCVCCLLSCVPIFATPWTVASQAPLSMEFSRQEYWSSLPYPAPGDLPDPRIEPRSPESPSASAGRFFTTVPPGKSHVLTVCVCSVTTVVSNSSRLHGV